MTSATTQMNGIERAVPGGGEVDQLAVLREVHLSDHRVLTKSTKQAKCLKENNKKSVLSASYIYRREVVSRETKTERRNEFSKAGPRTA